MYMYYTCSLKEGHAPGHVHIWQSKVFVVSSQICFNPNIKYLIIVLYDVSHHMIIAYHHHHHPVQAA